MIDIGYQKGEHTNSTINLNVLLTLGEIVMACDHKTLILAERTIYKNGILVSDVDVIMCPECGYFALARMKKKQLKKVKKIAPPKPKQKTIPPKAAAVKPQPQEVDNRLKNALKGELKKLGVTSRKSYGADNSPKPTGVNSNSKQPAKTSPYPTPQDNLAVKAQGITPLKTEGKKTKKK